MNPRIAIATLTVLSLAACGKHKGSDAPAPAAPAAEPAKAVTALVVPPTPPAAPSETVVSDTPAAGRFGVQIDVFDKNLSRAQISKDETLPEKRVLICEKKRETEQESLTYLRSEPLFVSKDPKTAAQLMVNYSISRTEETIDGETRGLNNVHVQIERYNEMAPKFEKVADIEEERILGGSFDKIISHPDFWIRIRFSSEMQKECAGLDERTAARAAEAEKSAEE